MNYSYNPSEFSSDKEYAEFVGQMEQGWGGPYNPQSPLGRKINKARFQYQEPIRKESGGPQSRDELEKQLLVSPLED